MAEWRISLSCATGPSGSLMKLDHVREAYEALSARASEIVRQLSLAGVALVWLFRSEKFGSPELPPPLVSAALFFFLALLLDFLQYLSGTMIWHIYFRRKENQGAKLESQVSAPVQLSWPTWIIFYAKSLTVVFAYAWYVIPFLAHRFVWG
jgi:hypothetical protein